MEPLGAGDPRQIGAYRLLGRLGAGGMGRVYLGRTAGGRTVAVKVVRSELADDTDFRARFRQEVAAARRVGGAWTAAVLDADTESEHPWVATGYVPGPGLDAAVRDFGVLPGPSVRMLGVGLADSLAAVHATGLVHRDLKPSNVLLTLDGPRLIDFGIARALDAATALTRSGYVVGSPGYMSPEQGAGEPAGPESDVFSLGGVLAYAATGVGPFGDSASAPVLLYRVMHEPPRLDGMAAMADGPLREIVEHCLAKDPADRPTPGQLREALGGVGPADGWLPPLLVASVGRRTAELLDLETVGEGAALSGGASGSWPGPGAGSGVTGGGSVAGFGPAPVMDATPAGATPAFGYGGTGAFGGTGGFAPADATPAGYQPPYPPLPAPAAAPARSRRALVAVGALVALGVLAAVLVPVLNGNGSSGGGGGPTAGSSSPTVSGQTTGTTTTTAGTTGTGGSDGSGDDSVPVPPAPPSPGPSSPNAIPAVFLGTWTAVMTTSDGLLSEPTTIAIRPGAVGVENTTSITTVTGLSAACLGGEELVSATATSITFHDRLLPGSTAGLCSAGTGTQVFTLNPDGTLHHRDDAPGSGNPSGDFRKVK
ncbi:serine/threonine-protein kinase [Streptacidiphilus sp. N1-3]|uniref:Serine/threonine-protein kinase n=1 Tax=Streptacidiphilus alkalitolerans TaxID=3342712 RepID=A0ABV6X529_9ACTN